MRPPEFTGGNVLQEELRYGHSQSASMRPPEFTGGNARKLIGNCLRRWALQ